MQRAAGIEGVQVSQSVIVAECLGGPLDGDTLHFSLKQNVVEVMQHEETGYIAAVATGATPSRQYAQIGYYERMGNIARWRVNA